MYIHTTAPWPSRSGDLLRSICICIYTHTYIYLHTTAPWPLEADQEIYYLGVVNFLCEYSVKVRSETAIKRLLGHDKMMLPVSMFSHACICLAYMLMFWMYYCCVNTCTQQHVPLLWITECSDGTDVMCMCSADWPLHVCQKFLKVFEQVSHDCGLIMAATTEHDRRWKGASLEISFASFLAFLLWFL
jgi:hypothetical protein